MKKRWVRGIKLRELILFRFSFRLIMFWISSQPPFFVFRSVLMSSTTRWSLASLHSFLFLSLTPILSSFLSFSIFLFSLPTFYQFADFKFHSFFDYNFCFQCIIWESVLIFSKGKSTNSQCWGHWQPILIESIQMDWIHERINSSYFQFSWFSE